MTLGSTHTGYVYIQSWALAVFFNFFNKVPSSEYVYANWPS